jgi:hypothetical protein
MKSLSGTDSVIRIETSNMVTFLCGSKDTMQAMRKKWPTGKAIMNIDDAYSMLQSHPDKLLITIQCFYTPAAVEMAFPEKKGGWEHLKEKVD